MRSRSTGVVLALVLAVVTANAESRDPLANSRVRVIHSYNYSTGLDPGDPFAPWFPDIDNWYQYLNWSQKGRVSLAAFSAVACHPKPPSIVHVLGEGEQVAVTSEYPAGSNLAPRACGKRLTLWVRQVSSADDGCTVDVLDDTNRNLTRKEANLRVIHGVPSAALDGVQLGAVGVGCLTPALSFPANVLLTVPLGTYVFGVFPSSDPDCSGEPLSGLTAKPVKLHARTAYTAIAWAQPNDPTGFQLRLQRDFRRPGCRFHVEGDGLP